MRIRLTKATAPEPARLSDIEVIGLYQSAFWLINKYCFAGELPEIDIQPAQDQTGENMNVRAYFSFDPERKEKPYIVLQLDPYSDPGDGISEEDIGDLFHELIHYHCYLKQIEDTTPGFQFHNLEFKKAVETHGGICGYSDDEIGYSDTHLNADTLHKIFNEI